MDQLTLLGTISDPHPKFIEKTVCVRWQGGWYDQIIFGENKGKKLTIEYMLKVIIGQIDFKSGL